MTYDRERLAEMREDPARFRPTARALERAACQIVKRGGAFGRRKVFLRDLAKEVGLPMRRLAPIADSFHRLGWIKLVRADLVAAMDPTAVAESEIDNGIARYHFIEADDC